MLSRPETVITFVARKTWNVGPKQVCAPSQKFTQITRGHHRAGSQGGDGGRLYLGAHNWEFGTLPQGRTKSVSLVDTQCWCNAWT